MQVLFVFTLKVYRDCQGVPINTTNSLVVHNVPGLTTIPLNYISVSDLSPNCNTVNGSNIQFSCGSNNLGYGGNGNGAVEEHIFRSDTIRIFGTPDINGWHFTWDSCCRNNAFQIFKSIFNRFYIKSRYVPIYRYPWNNSS